MKNKPANVILIGAILGLIVGVLFIFVQPLFGMSPLTERHAQGYMKLSEMSYSAAINSAWFIHLFISVCYGIACSIALLISARVTLYSIQILILSWFTTVIAPPANALIVKAIGTKSFPSLANLPALNFSVDAKLIFHLVFFAVIAAILWGYQYSRKKT